MGKRKESEKAVVVVEESLEAEAAEPAAKAAKTAKAAEPAVRNISEEDAKDWLRRKRSSAKRRGYKKKSLEAGFGVGRGRDVTASTMTLHDTRRLMRFAPKNLDAASYEEEEVLERLALTAESIPAASAREAQPFLEGVHRHLVQEAVLRAVEMNIGNPTASVMHSVLRPYMANLQFTGGAPKGLLRHAVKEGALTLFQDDEERHKEQKKVERAMAKAESEETKKNAAHGERFAKAEADKKAAAKKRRAEAKAARAAKAAAAV